MKRLMMLCAAMICATGLVACGPAQPEAEAPLAPEVTVAAPLPTDAWVGDWIGVEGNTLKIEATGTPGEYKILERTLDGPLSYTGRAAGATIAFQDADQQARTIQAGTGEQTGLKYLAGKTNCLWIASGRGFCRD